MRVYFEKPRTTVGLEGLDTIPHLDAQLTTSNTGLRLPVACCCTSLKLGLPAAHRFLNPVGASNTLAGSDQLAAHRCPQPTGKPEPTGGMASGLSDADDFKNGTGWQRATAINAMEAACPPPHFLGITQLGPCRHRLPPPATLTAPVLRGRQRRQANYQRCEGPCRRLPPAWPSRPAASVEWWIASMATPTMDYRLQAEVLRARWPQQVRPGLLAGDGADGSKASWWPANQAIASDAPRSPTARASPMPAFDLATTQALLKGACRGRWRVWQAALLASGLNSFLGTPRVVNCRF